MTDIARLQNTIKAFVRRGDKQYVAECMGIAVVTQGSTIDETISNLEEAISLHLEGENLEDLGLGPNPTLLVTLELDTHPRVA